MSAENLISLFALLLIVWACLSHVNFAEAIRRKVIAPRLKDYPSITVIRPIKGLDFGLEGNLKAAFDHGYPGKIEIIFVFDSPDEPAYPIVAHEILIAQKKDPECDAKIIFSGNPPKGRTGKLNAMIAGYEKSTGQLIGFADSDIRPDRETLRILTEKLISTPNSGSVFSPVCASDEIETFGDAGYALMLNGLYGSAVELASKKRRGRFDFIMGQLMIFKREAIEAIGGLEAVSGQLVDDMYIGKLLYRAGWDNIMASKAVPIKQKGINASEFWKIYLKWMIFSRTGLGFAFKLLNFARGFQFFIGLILFGSAIYIGSLSAGIIALLVPVTVSASITSLHRMLGGAKIPLRFSWMSAMLLFTAPFVLFRVFLSREVSWRGRTYELNADATLASEKSLGIVVPAATDGFSVIENKPASQNSDKVKEKQI